MGDFVHVADLKNLPPGALLGVDVAGRAIVLANVDGEIYALDGICTHMEARLAEGSLYEECLMCPVHGGEFDVRTGEAVTLPAVADLMTHRVRVEGSAILIDVGS